MKRVMLSMMVLAFFAHVPDAWAGTCSAWQRYHGTFCQEDANNAADELLYHDKYGISNKYTYMKYVYCPVESTQLLSVPPDGAWEVSAYTIDTVTVCAKDANVDDANGDKNLWMRVCYMNWTNTTQYCGSWYIKYSSSGDSCVDLGLPAYGVSNNLIYIESYLPPIYSGNASYLRGYFVAGDFTC